LISHQVPKQFPSISHQNPFVSIKFPKKSHQILFVLIKFSESSHQIPLVPINNPSISFCSHQVPKRFPSNFSSSHQNPFVPIEGRQMSTKVNGETRERLGQSTKRSVAVRGQAGRGLQWQADVCPVRQSRKSGISACQVLWRADLLLAWQSAALLPECARPKRWKTLNTPHGVLFGALSGPDSAALRRTVRFCRTV
jgi:hypothetical protein